MGEGLNSLPLKLLYKLINLRKVKLYMIAIIEIRVKTYEDKSVYN